MKTKVIVLKTVKTLPYNRSEHGYFYFRTNEAADKFMKKFKSHWCHIDWEKYPDEIELNDYWKKHIDDDPEDMAERNLSWGFNFARDNCDDELLPEESQFLDSFIKKIGGI